MYADCDLVTDYDGDSDVDADDYEYCMQDPDHLPDNFVY